MKRINATTVAWLIVGIGGLGASWADGFFAAHPGVMVVVLSIYKTLGSLLGPLVKAELPKREDA
jgi:hypothetical protein